MKPLLISSGEPAGIGPDLCLSLAGSEFPLVVLCDKRVLLARAKQLNKSLMIEEYQPGIFPTRKADHLTVLSLSCNADVVAGVPNPNNASYVLEMLKESADRCLSGEFAGVVTGPVNKAIINQAGYSFTGHTEFFASYCQTEEVVMMLACDVMKVALITTHLPLRNVAEAITPALINNIIKKLHHSLRYDFGIHDPRIYIAGLNPHAGEAGYLGKEEIDVIIPTIKILQSQGINIQGPMPADTMFTVSNTKKCDVFVAMYHDQGLSVLKYAGFGKAVNVTLGLPIIRTSVDHGTAFELAGTGLAEPNSLQAAVAMAAFMAHKRGRI